MPTAEQEAWEENLWQDIRKIVKEIIVILNTKSPRDNQFSIASGNSQEIINTYRTVRLTFTSRNYIRGNTSNPKIKYEINCFGRINVKNVNLIIPVSHNEIYTKKEIERAKNSILVKILEILEKSS